MWARLPISQTALRSRTAAARPKLGSKAGPQQCWTDGEQGLSWSTRSAVLAVGKFNADSRADILYLPRPNFVMVDYDIAFPVPVFKPNTFGIFLSQMSSPTVKVLGTANQ